MISNTIILVWLVVGGIMALTLLLFYSIELRSRIKLRRTEEELKVERMMSGILIKESDNVMFNNYDEIRHLISNAGPGQEKTINRILRSLDEPGSHNHVEKIYCSARDGEPMKWWKLLYGVFSGDALNHNSVGVLINIDEKLRNADEISTQEGLLNHRRVSNKLCSMLLLFTLDPISRINEICKQLADGNNLTDDEIATLKYDLKDMISYFRNITNDLSNHIAIETNTMRFNIQTIRVGDMVELIHEQFKLMFESAGCFFPLVIGRSDTYINVDPDALMEIMRQLLENAVKFSRHANVAIGWKSVLSHGKVEIFIEDSGTGIEEEHRKNIFEPGWMEHEQIDGNGVGLSIAKAFTEAMNGEIVCTSEVGIGSRFMLIFPIVETPNI